jgi:hypothetical protein
VAGFGRVDVQSLPRWKLTCYEPVRPDALDVRTEKVTALVEARLSCCCSGLKTGVPSPGLQELWWELPGVLMLQNWLWPQKWAQGCGELG